MSERPQSVEEYRDAILAFFRRRLRQPEDAEDLCQETFARFQSRGRLRDPEKLESYLFRIARNLLLNHIKRRQVVGRLSDAETPVESVPDRGFRDPESEVHWGELQTRVRELLGQLPSEQRTAFELGVLQRLLYTEIAATTGWSVAKVKVNVYRARKRLIEDLRDYSLGADSPARIEGDGP
jgi:RNA polymerase sigma-70 factor (ECF subfamily)